MSTFALNIKNFSFSYGNTCVLNDVDLCVFQGEYVSIIGSNGVGKSTLLKAIIRIVRGNQGSIELLGKDIHNYSQKELGRLIGYVPQSRNPFCPYTVYEFVLMGRYPYLGAFSLETKEDKNIVDEALVRTDLTHLIHRSMSSLSGGERQRVYLAAALAQQPKILLLDEPTTHLDPQHQKQLHQTIMKVNQDLGVTILHVTHDLIHIKQWPQKVALFKEGQVKFYGEANEVITPENLEDIFKTSFLFIKHPKTGKDIITADIS